MVRRYTQTGGTERFCKRPYLHSLSLFPMDGKSLSPRSAVAAGKPVGQSDFLAFTDDFSNHRIDSNPDVKAVLIFVAQVSPLTALFVPADQVVDELLGSSERRMTFRGLLTRSKIAQSSCSGVKRIQVRSASPSMAVGSLRSVVEVRSEGLGTRLATIREKSKVPKRQKSLYWAGRVYLARNVK